MLAGELHNSSASSLDYMRPIWPKLAAIPLNTVLTPVYWELVEPTEGKFDFTLVDGLIHQARQSHLHLVFLWFGAWKNGWSSNSPLWVKKDAKRFPLVIEKDGTVDELLTPLGSNTLQAEMIAYAALMRHIREVDGQQHTVVMMQVENEIHLLSHSRDDSPLANQAFQQPVPAQLTNYMQQHRNSLFPQFKKIWDAAGDKTSGSWSDVFGPAADDMFMTWHFGLYVNQIAAAGKAEYPIPMYENTALMGLDLNAPLQNFPPGGPTPAAIDVWRASGSAIDLYSPDIYMKNFADWCNWYHQAGNPLFIPEAGGGPANVFYAIGQDDAMGYSPFGIDSMRSFSPIAPRTATGNSPSGIVSSRATGNSLGSSYSILMQMAPIILQHEGDGTMTGFVLDQDHPSETITMNGYKLDISMARSYGGQSSQGYGLVIATGPNEFLGVGSSFRVTFTPVSPGPPNVGIGYVEQGSYSKGVWIPSRRLSGDEDGQGQSWSLAAGQPNIERVVVYRFP